MSATSQDQVLQKEAWQQGEQTAPAASTSVPGGSRPSSRIRCAALTHPARSGPRMPRTVVASAGLCVSRTRPELRNAGEKLRQAQRNSGTCPGFQSGAGPWPDGIRLRDPHCTDHLLLVVLWIIAAVVRADECPVVDRSV